MSLLALHPWLTAAGLALVLTPVAHLLYAAWVRRRFPLAGQVFEHEGVRLHYRRSGAGPVVVLVHGANGTSDDFPRELLQELARDHTVLALDRPGHGWSGVLGGPLGMHENAQALLALVRLHPGGPATIVGHSYGAAVAMRAALESPESIGHVIAVTPCTALDPRNSRYARVPLAGEPIGLPLFHFLSLLCMPFGVPLRKEAWHPHAAPAGWSASRAFAYVPSQMHAVTRNFRTLHADVAWLEDHLPHLQCRLTVLAGADDKITPPARHVDWLRSIVPNARFEVLPGVGHWLPRLRPDLVVAAVRDEEPAQPPGPSRR